MKRTPRGYDGILTTSKTIGEMLPDVLNRMQKKNVEPANDVMKAWAPLIGPQGAKLTEAVSFVDGVLTVLVKSSTLYSLLCQHEKPHLLRRLQDQFPKTQVRNIFFRIG